MKKLKVFWGHTATVGGAYYRCMSYALDMKRQKIANCTYIDWDPKIMGNIPNSWERVQLMDSERREGIVQQLNAMVRNSDVTIYQHFIHPIGLALLRMQQDLYKKPIVMELDDLFTDIPALNPSSEKCHPGTEMYKVTAGQLKHSDAVVVSTEYLKEQYLKYNKNIYVIPNCIDFKIWDKITRKKSKKGKVRIGFAGASGHVDDHQLLRGVLPVILKKYKNVEVVFIGTTQYPTWLVELANKTGQIKFISHWENILDYPQYLANFGFDIGIAPLRDYAFNRGKSNLRYLEYSGLKIPTVASDVRPFRESITHGKNGYLCREDKDWIKVLSELIENKELRKTIGQAGYGNVKQNFNLALVSKQYLELLKKIREDYNDKLQPDS